mgnify:FL=1
MGVPVYTGFAKKAAGEFDEIANGLMSGKSSMLPGFAGNQPLTPVAVPNQIPATATNNGVIQNQSQHGQVGPQGLLGMNSDQLGYALGMLAQALAPNENSVGGKLGKVGVGMAQQSAFKKASAGDLSSSGILSTEQQSGAEASKLKKEQMDFQRQEAKIGHAKDILKLAGEFKKLNLDANSLIEDLMLKDRQIGVQEGSQEWEESLKKFNQEKELAGIRGAAYSNMSNANNPYFGYGGMSVVGSVDDAVTSAAYALSGEDIGNRFVNEILKRDPQTILAEKYGPEVASAWMIESRKAFLSNKPAPSIEEIKASMGSRVAQPTATPSPVSTTQPTPAPSTQQTPTSLSTNPYTNQTSTMTPTAQPTNTPQPTPTNYFRPQQPIPTATPTTKSSAAKSSEGRKVPKLSISDVTPEKLRELFPNLPAGATPVTKSLNGKDYVTFLDPATGKYKVLFEVTK